MIPWFPGTLRSWELVRASVTTTQTRYVLRFPQVLWSRADFVQFSDSFRQFRTVSDSFRQFWRAEPQPRRNEECSKYCHYIDLTPTRLCARDHDVHRRLGITQYNYILTTPRRSAVIYFPASRFRHFGAFSDSFRQFPTVWLAFKY